jgi:hypothetical protein
MRRFKSEVFACFFILAIAASIRPAFADPKNAFQASLQFTLGANVSENCPTIAVVPPKKRLVVEYVSATVGPVAYGTSLRFVQLVTQLGAGPLRYHNITQNFVGSLELLFGQQVKLYADGNVSVCVARTGLIVDTLLPVTATISGYLADN